MPWGMAEACAWGGGSIVNAIATGVGAAFPLNLRVAVEVSPSPVDVADGDVLRVLDRVKARLGVSGGVRVWVRSEVPRVGGLKSSSAFMNALLLALSDLFSLGLTPMDVLRLNAEVSREVGISVTGALDDAAASLLGVPVVTDNLAMRVLRVLEGPADDALVLLPPYGSGRGKDVGPIRGLIGVAAQMALAGEWARAMDINALAHAALYGYNMEPTLTVWGMGGHGGVSGTGPSHVFVPYIEDAARALERFGEVLRAEVPRGPCSRIGRPL